MNRCLIPASFILGMILSAAASAQSFPTRPPTLIVPFSPGGATDVLARMLAGPLEKQLGQAVIVENKPGADSRIGGRLVATSAPDGHTMIILAGSSVSWPLFNKDPGVDVTKDLAPAGVLVDGALLIVASSKSPFNSFREMIDYAKKNPGKVTWSLPSRSGEPALYLYLLKAKAGVDMLEVVYKGSAPQQTAVVTSEVDIGQFAPGRALQMQQSGQGKVLAVSGDRRDAQFPSVPTMKELGYDGMVNYDFGLLGPAGMSTAIVNRWNAAAVAALKDSVVVNGAAKFGFNIIGSTAAEHAAQQKRAYENWKLAAQAGKVQPE